MPKAMVLSGDSYQLLKPRTIPNLPPTHALTQEDASYEPAEKRWKAGQFRGLIADKGYFQEYFHTLLARELMASGYKLRRTDRGWHQWEMACITDREVEQFSKRNELIDTLSEQRELTPEEEKRLAQQERDSKTTKRFHGETEIENWRQQMGPERWDSITAEGAKRGPQLKLPIDPREVRSNPTLPNIP